MSPPAATSEQRDRGVVQSPSELKHNTPPWQADGTIRARAASLTTKHSATKSDTTPAAAGWDLEQSPFHEGELAVQERLGVRAKIDAQGRRAVRRYLTDQHKEFFPSLPYVFVGSVDKDGQPWASILLNKPGFVWPTSSTTLSIHAQVLYGDPLSDSLCPGAEIAVLGAQLHTRRRNRVVGEVTSVREDGFGVSVRQTMGLCPQYIQGREPEFFRDPMKVVSQQTHKLKALDTVSRDIIERADTYFVSSVNPSEVDDITRGVDVSHRGGRRGFVRVDDDGLLTAPEFVGNFMFNTVGNFQIDNRAGLLFVDFEHGDVVYIAARAEIVWDGPEVRAFTGAQRLIQYHINQVIRVEQSMPAKFTPPDDSPLLSHTGTWQDVARTIDAERNRNEWRPFRISRMQSENVGGTIRSFYFEPADGRGLAAFSAGQFLPIRASLSGWDQPRPVMRTYTLSTAAGPPTYRISVKREGKGGFSDWLHDKASVNDLVDAMIPRGTFTFDADPRRSVVLISAGVGITPFVAMIDSLLVNNGRTRHHGPIWFLHGTRNSATHAFASYLSDKQELHSNLQSHIRYSRPLSEDKLGLTHDSEGKIDIELLKAVLPFDDHEFYLCGPGSLMQEIFDGLTDLGVRNERIHFESFGPASVTRSVISDATPTGLGTSGNAMAVSFATSGKQAMWREGGGSLLELAEAAGIAPLSSCRSGICGTCTTRVLGGAVEYTRSPTHDIEDGEALICISRPRARPEVSKDEADVILDL